MRKAPAVDTNLLTIGVRWYLLRTHHHSEVRADANLLESGIESFLPMLPTHRRRNVSSEPLFPQYLFARFDFQASSRLVRFSRGIQDIVHLGGGPAILEDDVIALLRQRCQDMAASVERPLERGEQVLIDAGPFQSLGAVVQSRVPARDRVQVLLTSIGPACRVEVPSQWLLRSGA